MSQNALNDMRRDFKPLVQDRAGHAAEVVQHPTRARITKAGIERSTGGRPALKTRLPAAEDMLATIALPASENIQAGGLNGIMKALPAFIRLAGMSSTPETKLTSRHSRSPISLRREPHKMISLTMLP
jgi:hypothetical protein